MPAVPGEEAKAILERGAAHIRDVGHEQGFADISRADGGYVDGELYLFVTRRTGPRWHMARMRCLSARI